jgi:very-short-patch-repair endonuclease
MNNFTVMVRRIYDPKRAAFAEDLRKGMTKAEACLWKYALKAGMLKGYGFHRQWPMFGFIADFYCAELKLIVEVDGGYHGTAAQQERDALRTTVLEKEGFRVVRFTNEQVLQHMASVIGSLEELVEKIEKEQGDRSRENWSQKRG